MPQDVALPLLWGGGEGTLSRTRRKIKSVARESRDRSVGLRITPWTQRLAFLTLRQASRSGRTSPTNYKDPISRGVEWHWNFPIAGLESFFIHCQIFQTAKCSRRATAKCSVISCQGELELSPINMQKKIFPSSYRTAAEPPPTPPPMESPVASPRQVRMVIQELEDSPSQCALRQTSRSGHTSPTTYNNPISIPVEWHWTFRIAGLESFFIHCQIFHFQRTTPTKSTRRPPPNGYMSPNVHT